MSVPLKIVGLTRDMPNMPSISIQKDFIRAWYGRTYPQKGNFDGYRDVPCYESLENIKVIQNDVDIILVYHHKVLSGTPAELQNILADLNEHNITVRFGNLNLNFSTKKGKELLNRLIYFDEYFDELIPKMNERLDSLAWTGRSPFGFRVVGKRKDKKLEIDPAQWQLVSQVMFRRFVLDEVYNTISSKLNQQGYRTSKTKEHLFSPTHIMRICNHHLIRNLFDEDNDPRSRQIPSTIPKWKVQ